MADSSEVDAALVAKLLNDATLMSILTDGVWFDEASPSATKFVIVSLINEHDERQFGGCAYEDALYLVKAVVLSTTGADVKTAAARIHALLENGTIAPTGYSLMTVHREERIRETEIDQVDTSIRWQHRGGRYRVMVSPT